MENEEEFIFEIRDALRENYPDEFQNNNELTQAAVLAPLFQDHGIWKILYIRRSNFLENHKGEVAFPGGGKEPSDKDLIQTALRETQEEIGIPAEKIKILGTLPQIATVTKYLVTPVIGVIDWPAKIIENSLEVSRSFSIPLNWLMDENNWKLQEFELPNKRYVKTVVYDPYDGETLWGFTAKVTHQLIEIIKKQER